MKAIVIEIYENYCIVMTEDGQFLKYKAVAGSVEIGDEVVVNKAHEVKAAKFVARGLAIAAAVVVIVIGGFFSYKYLNKFYPAGGIMEVARAGAEKKEVYRAKALVEEEAIKGAEETAAAVEPVESAADEVNELGLLYEKDFAIEEGIEAKETIGDIYFKYEAFESDGKKKLLISFKNTSESFSFNGNADIILLSGDNILEELHIDLVDLGVQKEKEVTVLYKEEATILRLRLTGEFN